MPRFFSTSRTGSPPVPCGSPSSLYLAVYGGAEVIRYALERLGIPSGLSAVMVGDRKYDIVGARGVGIASIGVLYGYGTRAELSEAGAPFLAADIAELGSLLMPERVP